MTLHRRIICAIAVLAVDTVAILSFKTVGAAPLPPAQMLQFQAGKALSIPLGFKKISSGPGMEVYQKDYSTTRKSPDFVTIVNLQQATMSSVYASSLVKLPLTDFWNASLNANTATRKLKAVVNGTFFDGPISSPYASGLTLGLKVRGEVINLGVPSKLSKAATFSFNKTSAAIEPYSESTFKDLNQPDVIGVYNETLKIKPSESTGRTWIGLRDKVSPGRYKTALIFTSASSTWDEAYKGIKGFSPDRIAQLDGGGSTGLIVDGVKKINGGLTGRWVPHAIAIYFGK